MESWNHVKLEVYMIKYAHRGLNPSLILGREAFYHYTMCARLLFSYFISFLFPV